MQRGFSGLVELDVRGQTDGQIRSRCWLHAAFFTVDHGNRRAPVTLAGYPPVAQAEGGAFAAKALALGMISNGDLRLF